MATKRLKPDTPSRRFNVVPTFDEITKSKPERKLTVALRKTGGRNHHGKITSRRRGGGHKRRYRIIDFKRNKYDMIGNVLAIEYDPNRSSRIALIQYEDGEKRYIIAPDGIKEDDKILSSMNDNTGFLCCLYDTYPLISPSPNTPEMNLFISSSNFIFVPVKNFWYTSSLVTTLSPNVERNPSGT